MFLVFVQLLSYIVTGRTLDATRCPRPGSVFPQGFLVDRYAGPDAQRQSVILANGVVPSGRGPVPSADRRASVPDPDAAGASTGSGGRRDGFDDDGEPVEFQRGETIQRRIELRDHREHRTEGDQRMGRAHVSAIV